jgi:hypothetical protein
LDENFRNSFCIASIAVLGKSGFVNLRRRSGVSVRARDCSDYRLDRIEGAAIADPETGSRPGNLLTAMHSGRKYDKLKYGIDIPSLS